MVPTNFVPWMPLTIESSVRKKKPLIPRVRQTNNECQMCSVEMSKKTHVCLDVLIQHFHKIDESQSQKLKISKFLLKKANCV